MSKLCFTSRTNARFSNMKARAFFGFVSRVIKVILKDSGYYANVDPPDEMTSKICMLVGRS